MTATVENRPELAELSARDVAILRAVAEGNAEVDRNALYLDGRCCCDQTAAHKLMRGGLIAPVTACAATGRVPAHVTVAGLRAIPA